MDRRVKASKDEVMDAVHGYHILKNRNSGCPMPKPTWISSTNPLARLKRSFSSETVSMTFRSSESQRLPKSQNYPHCSSFQRLVPICPSLSLIDICVLESDLPLQIMRVLTKNLPSDPKQDNYKNGKQTRRIFFSCHLTID